MSDRLAVRLLPAASFRRMPWKNGGGETIEVAAFPEGAGLDGFDWRVSMARVAAAGPFSLFPGIDRTLAVIEGGELLLHFATGAPVALTQTSEPYSFPADVAVAAALPAGAIVDLNAMSRRGRVAHRLRRLRLDAESPLPIDADEMLLLAPDGAVALRAGGQRLRLAAGDAALLSNGDGQAATVAPEAQTTLYAVAFRRLPLRFSGPARPTAQ